MLQVADDGSFWDVAEGKRPDIKDCAITEYTCDISSAAKPRMIYDNNLNRWFMDDRNYRAYKLKTRLMLEKLVVNMRPAIANLLKNG